MGPFQEHRKDRVIRNYFEMADPDMERDVRNRFRDILHYFQVISVVY